MEFSFADGKRTLAAARAIAAHAGAPDEVRYALAIFAAATRAATAGAPAAYRAELVNATGEPAWLPLALEARPKGADPAAAPAARFAKRVFVRARQTQAVRVFFDWAADARFEIDGVLLPADALAAPGPLVAG